MSGEGEDNSHRHSPFPIPQLSGLFAAKTRHDFPSLLSLVVFLRVWSKSEGIIEGGERERGSDSGSVSEW